MVKFHTNIDCCKRYMGCISGLSVAAINPLVGDTVLVYHDSAIDVYLKVVDRRWTMTNAATPILHCELHLLDGWTIPRLETFLRS